MKTNCSKLALGMTLVALLPVWVATVDGAPDKKKAKANPGDGAAVLYDQGMVAVEAQDFKTAVKHFTAASRKKRNDADILNMLAYSQRKGGDLDSAFDNYDRALSVRPRFPEAREYLGEAHLQAALQQVKYLRAYGEEGKEPLAELVEAFHNAVAEIDEGSDESTGDTVQTVPGDADTSAVVESDDAGN